MSIDALVHDRKMRLLIAAVVGGLLLLGSIYAAIQSRAAERDARIVVAARIVSAIDERLDNQIAALEGVRGMFRATGRINRDDLVLFLDSIRLTQRSPGMRGLGFAMLQPAGNVSEAEAIIAESYGRPIRVWPATDQRVVVPVTMLYPQDLANSRAIGFDMYSDAVRRKAMDRAWRTGHAATTDIVTLVQNQGTQREGIGPNPGFLIYVPMYQTGAAAVVRPGAPPPLRGFSYAPYNVADFFDDIFQHVERGGYAVEIIPADSRTPVYRLGTAGPDGYERSFLVGDRRWTMRLSSDGISLFSSRWIQVLALGMILTALTTLLLVIQGQRIAVLDELAQERAARAAEKDLLIGEMLHRIKNSFARIGALSRLTARETATIEEYQQIFDGRLQALSKAQELLVGGGELNDSAPLETIIRNELDLVGRGSRARDVISGPQVLLDGSAAQSVALVLHELATNSVKYGALSGHGQLSVEWTHENDEVHLHWQESGLAQQPVLTQENFGSRFVRGMIEGYLRGTITREAGHHAIFIRLVWAAPQTKLQSENQV